MKTSVIEVQLPGTLSLKATTMLFMECGQDRVYCDWPVMVGLEHVAMLDGIEEKDLSTIHR